MEIEVAEYRQTNSLLTQARLRLPSPNCPGYPMSRQELADAVNAWQWQTYQRLDRVDEHDIGRLERGETRWPGRYRREALRAVLGARTDSELGLYPNRRPRHRPASSLAGPVDKAAVHPVGAPTGGTARDADSRLKFVLANPTKVDLMTVAHLRQKVEELDAEYHRIPAATLLGRAGQRHGQIAFLRAAAPNGKARRDLHAAAAESATLMGQLVWDASLRRDHTAALSCFDEAAQAAAECGNTIAAARTELRRSYVALYGQKDPTAGLAIATRAASISQSSSNVLAGLALLHVAEAHAMRQQRTDCEQALTAAEHHLNRIDDTDEAAALFTPTDLSRMAGSCYLFLGEPRRATVHLTDCLRQADRQTKAAAVAAANLALAYARQSKVNEAVGSLHQALDVVETTHGGGGLTVAFTAGRALNPWRDHPAVQQVHDRLLTLMAA